MWKRLPFAGTERLQARDVLRTGHGKKRPSRGDGEEERERETESEVLVWVLPSRTWYDSGVCHGQTRLQAEVAPVVDMDTQTEKLAERIISASSFSICVDGGCACARHAGRHQGEGL